MKKLLTLLTLAFSIYANAQMCFTSNDSFLVQNRVDIICTADFNNDGKPDLATANNYDKKAHILLGMGNGIFDTTSTHAFPIDSIARSITSADFNNDGNPDIAIAYNGSIPGVCIILGNGTGSFGSATTFTLTDNPSKIINADFNGDGNIDLATLNNSTISILLGNGSGNFATANFSTPNPYMTLISADFNGDGKMDLAAATSSPSQAYVFLGAGTGGFSAPTSYSINSNYCFAIASADVNADGKMDLVAANFWPATVSVLLGNGSGGFAAATAYQGIQNSASIAIADYDGDGKLDIATFSGLLLEIFIGNGTGGFANSVGFKISKTYQTFQNNPAFVNADFNNDGKTDVATANGVNEVYIGLNSLHKHISITASSTNICSGGSTVLTASGSTQYIWSTSATTNTISVAPTVNTTYTVSDGTNCSDTALININASIAATPNICMVTTDAASGYNYNIVYWDKTLYTNVDSFIVYRQVSLNYVRIGAVSKNSLSEFTDTAFSIGGPNGGNPQYSSWFYKLAIKDTCGNISAMSPYHQTMFVQENNANFSWNAYTVESGQANPLTGYSFLRDDNNTGTWHVLVNTSGISTTDPNYSSYPNGNWRVDANGFNCTPTLRLAGNNTQSTYVNSHSNTTKPVATGINQLPNNTQISIYPNPAQNNFTIQTSANQKQVVNIFDLTGKQVLSQNINGTTTIDGSKLNEGVYYISISGNEGVVNKKLVIVK